MNNRQVESDRFAAPRSRLVNMRRRADDLSDNSVAINFNNPIHDLNTQVQPQNTQIAVETVKPTSLAVNFQELAQTTPIIDAAKISDDTCDAIMKIQSTSDSNEIAREIERLRTISAQITGDNIPANLIELRASIEKFLQIADKNFSTPSQPEDASSIIINTVTKPTASESKPQTITPSVTPIKKIETPVTTKAKTKRFASKKKAARIKTESEISENTLKNTGSTLEKSISEFCPRKKKINKFRLGVAMVTATAGIAAVVGIVCMNIPDISVRVAAMQTGIDAKYPSYVPKDYSIYGIDSEEGKITMIFNGPEDSGFTLSEEKSSWDSAALLRNYVTPNWKDNYITTHEQGITIYISDHSSDAAWVSGGILYKISSTGPRLTKKQVRNIALSL